MAKYREISIISGAPVTVHQLRGLRANCDWVRAVRLSTVGVWGRLIGDTWKPSSSDGTTAYPLTPVRIDLRHCDRVYCAVRAYASGAGAWRVLIGMHGQASPDDTLGLIRVDLTASAAGYIEGTGYCDPGQSTERVCLPSVTLSRTSGTATLSIASLALYATRTAAQDHGPAQLAPAASADLQAPLESASVLFDEPSVMIGWLGEYTLPVSSTVALRWGYAGDAIQEDATVTARCVVYQPLANSGKTFALEHKHASGATYATQISNAAVWRGVSVDLPVAAHPDGKTGAYTPAGALTASATADADRPVLTAASVDVTLGDHCKNLVFGSVTPRSRDLVTAALMASVTNAGAAGTASRAGCVAGGLAVGGRAYSLTSTSQTIYRGHVWTLDDDYDGHTSTTATYTVTIRMSASASAAVTLEVSIGGGAAGAVALSVSGSDGVYTGTVSVSRDVTQVVQTIDITAKSSPNITATVYSVHVCRRQA